MWCNFAVFTLLTQRTGAGQMQSYAEKFQIFNSKQELLFSATDKAVTVGAKSLTVPGKLPMGGPIHWPYQLGYTRGPVTDRFKLTTAPG